MAQAACSLERENEGDRQDVGICFRVPVLVLPVLLPLHALEVLREQVLPRQLVVVAEVVQTLVDVEMDLIIPHCKSNSEAGGEHEKIEDPRGCVVFGKYAYGFISYNSNLSFHGSCVWVLVCVTLRLG